MDILTKAKNLYQELVLNVNALQYVQKKLARKGLDPDEYETLYKEEFRISMTIVGSYNDLKDLLTEMENEKIQPFFVKRMKSNIKKIVSEETYDV